ncbi:Dihydroorotase [Scedosporium apiospermum]|uniref:dihydroorotase n=1 Tax=Pseudallescheria apiosperma TaxID=563466 RepID=A0A084G689_PSEDA|nr:Dihydroorotase [Scedosporium apiospermum]KEZ42851.1 Dihydroorotase [Scedosporium apiospermum]
MRLRELQSLELPATADFHVHLRQGDMMKLVTPTIRKGGVDTVYVMPNLTPPITTVARALEYKAELEAIDHSVKYLMSLFLHPDVTPEVITEAAKAGISGVKLYPQGVTTNSENGVSTIEDYFPVFTAMEKHDLVLNLHGEAVSGPPDLTLEEAFLPMLKKIHEAHPNLRIVLEHCSTKAAVAAVRACGPSVGATITAHHLFLTGDISRVNPHAFCKPIPKTPEDRDALLQAVVSGDTKFFFGSDSAPHPLTAKTASQSPPAGVFTQPLATQYVILALEEATERGVVKEEDVTQERLAQFLSLSGRKFYKLLHGEGEVPRIKLERKASRIPTHIANEAGTLQVGLVRAETPIMSLSWV